MLGPSIGAQGMFDRWKLSDARPFVSIGGK